MWSLIQSASIWVLGLANLAFVIYAFRSVEKS
jgi:hypothetical protein